MSSADAPRPPRQDRRKERTRAALIGAAQRLVSEGEDGHASIQAITELADVGFGSFYNYFSSKEELFDAATSLAVDDYLSWLDERTPDDADPINRLIESVRHTGRLALERPLVAAILARRLPLLEQADDPRGQRIRADVRAAIIVGGSAPETLEFEILVTAAFGAIMAVLRRTISLSPTETSDAAEVLAQAVVRLVSPPSNGSAR
ncbi:TetR/AcrR family transcriptional regulator [Plantibacter flavus]|uniref:TetR/AcrR family transcriptional regulator n=1 Tax=Plantibacter flavus TaxID=150123 RepID=UPI003F1582DD